MSGDYIEVVNIINEITKIYSQAYKPFFIIRPDRYINVDDLIQDLIHRIPKWDGHANLFARNSLHDYSAFRVNSYGNGYLYVSRNTKIDNIYRLYDDAVRSGVSELTVNMISINDTIKYNQLLSFIILPFIESDLEVVSKSSAGGDKPNFSFDSATRIAQIHINTAQQNKTFEVKRIIRNIKVNFMFNDDLAQLWYQRLSGADNITLYSYNNCKTCRGFVMLNYYDRHDEPTKVKVFTKYIYSTKENNITSHTKNIPTSLRPMS
jgi:hypothetical protein